MYGFGFRMNVIRFFYKTPNTFDNRCLHEILTEYDAFSCENLILLNSIRCVDFVFHQGWDT